MAFQRVIAAAITGAAAFILAACTAHLPPAMYAPQAAFAAPYYLDSGDQIQITVYGQEDLSRVYPIGPTGSISVPLIGAVNARGRTTDQVENTVVTALAAGYLRDPDVSVEVQAYRPFFILGEVRAPGQYAFVSGISVDEAVAIAGGYTYRAYRNAVEIRRRTPEGMMAASAPFDMPVLPGDTITVHERIF